MFRVEGSHIMNFGKNNQATALSVQSNTDNENRHITVNEKPDDRISQEWDVVYADEWKGEPGKGELNEDFGLYVQRPFYIVSALGSKRYLEVITTETWLSRPKMVKKDKSGGSTNNHSPSRPRSTTNHGTSNLLVRLTLCKSTAPTHNGGRSSSIKETSLSMSVRKN
jgi:hypothetical protein